MMRNTKEIPIDFLNELYSDLPGMETIVDIRYSDKEMSRQTEQISLFTDIPLNQVLSMLENN